MARPELNCRGCAVMDAALHPGSRVVDGSPMKPRDYSQRLLIAGNVVINSGRDYQIASAPDRKPGLGQDTWAAVATAWITESTVALWDSQNGIAQRHGCPEIWSAGPQVCAIMRYRPGADPWHR